MLCRSGSGMASFCLLGLSESIEGCMSGTNKMGASCAWRDFATQKGFPKRKDVKILALPSD